MTVACPLRHQGIEHTGRKWWSAPLPILQSALQACGLTAESISRIMALSSRDSIWSPATRAIMPSGYENNVGIVTDPGTGGQVLEFSTKAVQIATMRRRRRHQHGD